MDWNLILAILAGIAAFSVAIKSLPVLWDAAKSVYEFFAGLGEIKELPKHLQAQGGVATQLAEITEGISSLSKELREHMDEEERIRGEETALVEKLVNIVSNQDSIVFRQTTLLSDIAYYEIVKNGEWSYQWVNDAWVDLTGLTLKEVRAIGWQSIIGEEEMDMILPQINNARDNGLPVDVDFTIVNHKTNKKTSIRMIGYPMTTIYDETTRYLGAIHRNM